MSFVRSKVIKGHTYFYLQASHRVGGSVVSQHIKYLGKSGRFKGSSKELGTTQEYHSSSYDRLPEEKRKEIDLITKYKREIFKNKDDKHTIRALGRLAKKGIDTKTYVYNKETGEYIPERKALHDKIIKEMTDKPSAVAKKDEKPVVIMLGGSPASGKSEVVKRLIPNPEKYVDIDNDSIKEKLPEYRGINASYLHEEASDVYGAVKEKAIRDRKNIILDATLKNTDKAIADIKKFQKLGYTVKVYGTNISPEINVESGTKRFQKKGRYVPIEYIVQNTPKINKSVLDVSKYADESKIYDTTIKGRENAKVIYSKGS